MSKHILDRKVLEDLSNLPAQQTKTSCKKPNYSVSDMQSVIQLQTMENLMELQTKHMSFEKIMELTNLDNGKMMCGFIQLSQQCQFCGSNMRIKKDKGKKVYAMVPFLMELCCHPKQF